MNLDLLETPAGGAALLIRQMLVAVPSRGRDHGLHAAAAERSVGVAAKNKSNRR
jgi:hypothetical protein